MIKAAVIYEGTAYILTDAEMVFRIRVNYDTDVRIERIDNTDAMQEFNAMRQRHEPRWPR